MAPTVRILQLAQADTLTAQDTAVVVDVLRATTTICAMFEQGAVRVHPVRTPEDAKRVASGLDDPILVGERDRGALPGFIDNSPATILTRDLTGREVVFTTTNGTQALLACDAAGAVVAGALVNAATLASMLADATSVAVVCCGWQGTPESDDDAAGAYLADIIAGRPADAEAARRDIQASTSATKLTAHGKAADVAIALSIDAYRVVPVLRDGVLTPWAP